jgi:hypothetical protein
MARRTHVHLAHGPQVENNMTSVERMLEYIDLPQEPPLVEEGGTAAPADWPKSGDCDMRLLHVLASVQ